MCMYLCIEWSFQLHAFQFIHTPGQKYKTTLKNEEKNIVYNFLILKIRYMKDKA